LGIDIYIGGYHPTLFIMADPSAILLRQSIVLAANKIPDENVSAEMKKCCEEFLALLNKTAEKISEKKSDSNDKSKSEASAPPTKTLVQTPYPHSYGTYQLNYQMDHVLNAKKELYFETFFEVDNDNVGWSYGIQTRTRKDNLPNVMLTQITVDARKNSLVASIIMNGKNVEEKCEIFGSFAFYIPSGTCKPIALANNTLSTPARISPSVNKLTVMPTKYFKLYDDSTTNRVLVKFSNGSYYGAGPECLFVIHSVPECTIPKGSLVHKEKMFGIFEEYVLPADTMVSVDIDH